MDLQDCNTKVTQKRSITEDNNVKRKKKLKANPSTKKLIERCIREKNDLTDSFKMYSQTFQEFARKYHLVEENFLKYDKSYTALVAGVSKGFPELLDTQLNDEPLQNTKEIGREMDCETVTNQTKPLANMEIVFEMMILKETTTRLFDMYDVLQKEADLKKAFLKQLVEQEELYKKHFEVFKRNMMNPIAVGNNHPDFIAKSSYYINKLCSGLEEMKSKREKLEINCGKNNSDLVKSSQMKENEVTILNKENPQAKYAARSKTTETQSSQSSGICELDESLSSVENLQLLTDKVLQPNFKNCENSNNQINNEGKGDINYQEKFSEKQLMQNIKKGFRISEISEFNEPLSPLESPPPPNEIAYPNVKHFGDTNNKEEKAEDNILNEKKCNGQLKKQRWPGDNSVPALDDMISSPEDPHVLGCNDCYGSTNLLNVTINTPEWENRQTPKKPDLQDTENDKSIVERLVTEIGSDLSSPDRYNAVPDFGSHFLVPETTMITGTQERFMSDGSLTPNHTFPETDVHSSNSVPESTGQFSMTMICCKSVFSDTTRIQEHLALKHRSKLCDICGLDVKTVENLELHTNERHKSHKVCMQCGKIQEKINFAAHLASHNEVIVKEKEHFEPFVRPKSFTKKNKLQTLEKKIKNLHYVCKYCEKQTSTRYETQKHNIEHLAEKFRKHICKVCYISFETEYNLIKHLKLSHLLNKNKCPDKIQCLICNIELDTEDLLFQHMTNEHQYNALVEKAAKGEERGNKKDQCTVCQVYFKNSKLRAIHTIMLHRTAPYRCNCSASFFTKSLLDFHQLKHTKDEEARYLIKYPRVPPNRD
uniref:C2H2-type domain-containing protein n=1 Tax=Homalodisca liturata TaxID=320908 RepID=A0A1B6HHS5_9HEMI